MAWHHHMRRGHELVARHSKNLLLKMVEKHPIVTFMLGATGTVVVYKKLTAAPVQGVQNSGPVL